MLTRKNLAKIVFIVIGCILLSWVNVQGHGALPPQPAPPIAPGEPPPIIKPPSGGKSSAVKAPPAAAPTAPTLSTEGITYDFVGGLLPQVIIDKSSPASGTVSVNMFDPSKVGIDLLNSYYTPFDPYQIDSAGSFSLPVAKKGDVFRPPLNYYLRLHVVLVILQTMVNLETCPEAPAAEYMVELGQPSLLGAQIAPDVSPAMMGSNWIRQGETGKRIADYVQSAVGDTAPQPPPEPAKGTTTLDTMVGHLITEELGKNYYFPGDLDFAPALRCLGEAAIPYLINAAKTNEHSLIKRNAVALLGTYDTPEVLKALRELLIANVDKDKVIRNRALSALLLRRDVAIVPLLIDQLKNGPDAYFKTYAAYALGILGDKRASKPLIDYLNSDSNNRDVQWSVLSALGLMGDNSEEVKNIAAKFNDRSRTITKLFAQLALYAMGDEAIAQQLALNPANRDPLLRVDYAAYYYITKILGKKGDKGFSILLSMVNNEPLDPRMRIMAMCQMKFTDQHIDILKDIITRDKNPSILKAYALYLLYTFNKKDVIPDAQDVLRKSFAKIDRKGIKVNGEGYDTVIAMRILGLLNANKETDLKELISILTKNIKTALPRSKDIGALLPKPPLMETAIQEMSQIDSKEAAHILLGLLESNDFPKRAEVAWVMGNMTPQPGVVRALVRALAAKDGWTRYCAYSSLKKITGQDFNCEWVSDPDATRKQAVDKWEKWLLEEGAKKFL